MSDPDPDAPREITLELPAVHSSVRVARSVLRSFGRMLGVPTSELDTLLLVASELLANAVDHGGGGRALDESELGTDARMSVHLCLLDGRWELDVVDEGGGAPDEVRELLASDAPPDLEDERGRGLFLLRELTDRLDVGPSESGRGLAFKAVREHGSGSE